MKQHRPTEAQIWQRVRGPEAQEQQTLHMLLRQLQADTDYLRQLSAQNPEQPLLKQLIQEYTGQNNCIKGILLLSVGSIPKTVGGSCDSLRRCYDHILQRLAAYRLRCADPIYGAAFTRLAGQSEAHCCTLAQLLGLGLREIKKSR